VSNTEIMKGPDWANDEKLTDSQVIPFKDVPESLSQDKGSNIGHPAVSVIGESLHFKGELSAGEDLLIEGTVEGKINQGKCCLTLKPNGKIIADVNATKIFIDGYVKGNLHATVGVTVRKTGKVEGNIVAPKVAIEEGATFNGSVDMRSPSESSNKN
jgi:cytoskeletal protein CcmA (bactofilin family)